MLDIQELQHLIEKIEVHGTMPVHVLLQNYVGTKIKVKTLGKESIQVSGILRTYTVFNHSVSLNVYVGHMYAGTIKVESKQTDLTLPVLAIPIRCELVS